MTMLPAMAALAFCLCWMSPAMRWEKKAMGRCSTFHMKEVLPTMASLPFILREYTALIHSTASLTAPKSTSARMKPPSQPTFSPVSSRSRKMCENTLYIIPMSEVMKVVSSMNATAAPAPSRRFLAKANTDFGLPPGWKSAPGSNSRHMPVKDWSKVSIDTA